MPKVITESTVEDATLAWLGELGYAILHGPEIEPEGPRVALGAGHEWCVAEGMT